MIRIGELEIENWLIMAPMAGITNLPFRIMVKGLGAGLVTTEMVSAMGLKKGQKKTFEYLRSAPDERPLAVQIFGSDPGVMALAANIGEEAGADVIDINMGCPVKKVIKTGAGAALLRDTEKIREIVSAVRTSCSVPLTVKIRAGWSPDKPAALEIARLVEDYGVDAVTIHPRFATQGYDGRADWSIIREVKDRVNIPVLGNGDVVNPSDALEMKRLTGCDGVMIGRAATRNPWIFKQILLLERGEPVTEPDLSERRALIMEYYGRLSEYMGEYRAAYCMRGLLIRYTKGLERSSRFRERISRVKDRASLVSTMDEYFLQLGAEGIL